MAHSKRVIINSVQTVTPAQPTPRPTTHYLSNLDLIFSEDFYIHTVYYFPPFNGVKSSADLILGLKESLAKVLVHYPVLAGRAIAAEDRRPYIDCNDNGVLLVEAVAAARFDEWKDLKDCAIEPYLNLGDASMTDDSAAPLLIIQVTLFSCGGFAIGYGRSHICTDAWSASEFMKSWSEVHSHLPISITPNFHTHLLKARIPPSVTKPVNDFVFTPKINSSSAAHLASPPTNLALATLYFSTPQVNAIVQEVRNGAWGYSTPTSFEALVGLCWKAMTEARDLRGRWDPPLPSGFFGNGAHSSCVRAKAGDLKHHHFSYAAKLIRDDKEASDLEYLRSAIDLLQVEMDKGKSVGFDSDIFSGTDLQGTINATFPVYDVDFGSGKPLHYSFTLNPLFGDGIAVILPTPEGGRSRFVSLSMAEEHMTKLMKTSCLWASWEKAKHVKFVSFECSSALISAFAAQGLLEVINLSHRLWIQALFHLIKHKSF